jgi:uncharacterized SAM-binding protein YcdF (DUF218 family)
METFYFLLKVSIDPLVFVLILSLVGFLLLLRSKNSRYFRLVFIFLFFILYLPSISPISNGLCYLLENEYLLNPHDNIDKLDIVVVLGGGVSENKYLKETMPSYQTASRIIHAVQILRKSNAKYLVCAGKGVGKLSEAQVMGIAAERLGILPTKIKIDSKSRNTQQHASELNNMLIDKDIKIGLVTSAFHMKRSEREFKKYFPNVISLPSDYLYSSLPLSLFSFWPKTTNFYKFSIALHEIIGIAWYKIQ